MPEGRGRMATMQQRSGHVAVEHSLTKEVRQAIPLFVYGRPMYSNSNRAGHIYFHPVVSSFFFFPRLISAVGDWMSTILPPMVWP